MNLDFRTAFQTLLVLIIIAVILSILAGIRTIRSGQRLLYYRKRRDLIARGWRTIFGAVVLVGVAFAINRYGTNSL